MSRTLSLTMRGAMNAPATGEIPVVLLTFAHEDFDDTLRLSSDPTERLSESPLLYGTTHDGEQYIFCPMSLALPDDIDERAPTARFMIENVSRELVELVRSISSPATVSIKMVLASSPDDVEIEWPSFDLRSVQYNANVMTIEVGLDALETEPFPSGTFAPSGFPSLF